MISEGDGPPAGGIGQAGSLGPHPAGVVAYFPVTDVDAAVSAAKDLGGTVAVEPWEISGLGRMAVVVDPQGNRIGVVAA